MGQIIIKFRDKNETYKKGMGRRINQKQRSNKPEIAKQQWLDWTDKTDYISEYIIRKWE